MVTKHKINRDHYIPQFLLRNFARKEGNHHLLLADKNGKTVRKDGIRNSFQIPGLYFRFELDEKSKRTGRHSHAAEVFLSKIESDAGKVANQMVGCKNLQELQRFVGDEKEAMKDLAVFHHIQFKRNPYISVNNNRLLGNFDVAEAIEHWIKIGVSCPDLEGDITRDVFLSLISTVEEREAIKKNHVTVAYIDTSVVSASKSFITGDVTHAVICGKQKGGAMWLPISPNIAIRINSDGHNQVIRPSSRLVKSINRFIYEGSEKLVVQNNDHFSEIAGLQELKYKNLGNVICCGYPKCLIDLGSGRFRHLARCF